MRTQEELIRKHESLAQKTIVIQKELGELRQALESLHAMKEMYTDALVKINALNKQLACTKCAMELLQWVMN